jgi:hypothetical protein
MHKVRAARSSIPSAASSIDWWLWLKRSHQNRLPEPDGDEVTKIPKDGEETRIELQLPLLEQHRSVMTNPARL